MIRHPDLTFGKNDIVYNMLAIGNDVGMMDVSVNNPMFGLMGWRKKGCPLCPDSRDGIHETLLGEKGSSGGRCILGM